MSVRRKARQRGGVNAGVDADAAKSWGTVAIIIFVVHCICCLIALYYSVKCHRGFNFGTAWGAMACPICFLCLYATDLYGGCF